MNVTPLRTTAAAGLALTAVLGLAACSQSDTTPAPTTSPTAAVATKYNECIDDVAQIWLEKPVAEYTFGDCQGVNLISSDTDYVLGAVGILSVESSNATVSVTDPKHIALSGSDNVVTYTGAAPEVDDQGERNTVTAAE